MPPLIVSCLDTRPPSARRFGLIHVVCLAASLAETKKAPSEGSDTLADQRSAARRQGRFGVFLNEVARRAKPTPRKGSAPAPAPLYSRFHSFRSTHTQTLAPPLEIEIWFA